MFKFMFKKNKKGGVDIDTEVTSQETIRSVKQGASEYAERAYKGEVTNEVRRMLYAKYSIHTDRTRALHDPHYRDRELVDAIARDIVDDLNLLD